MTEVEVNGRLLWPKFMYLVYFGGMSCLIPFLSIYFEDIGLSGKNFSIFP